MKKKKEKKTKKQIKKKKFFQMNNVWQCSKIKRHETQITCSDTCLLLAAGVQSKFSCCIWND